MPNGELKNVSIFKIVTFVKRGLHPRHVLTWLAEKRNQSFIPYLRWRVVTWIILAYSKV